MIKWQILHLIKIVSYLLLILLDKKTIVLDLDETLIHCNYNTDIPADVILPIIFPNGD